MKEHDERRRNPWVAIGKLMAAVFEFSGSIGAGAFLGWLADGHFGTEPWLLIVFTLLGTTAGFTRLIRLLKLFQRGR